MRLGPAVAGERGDGAEADHDAAADAVEAAAGGEGAAEALGGGSGERARRRRVAEHRDDDEDEAEPDDLQAGARRVGVDELGEEGEEEDRDLRVQEVHDDALAEEVRVRARRARPPGPPRRRGGALWTPSQTRYAAPANFTTVNASADEARIADTPIAAANTWISAPACTPSIDATPARRPCAMLVPTM